MVSDAVRALMKIFLSKPIALDGVSTGSARVLVFAVTISWSCYRIEVGPETHRETRYMLRVSLSPQQRGFVGI